MNPIDNPDRKLPGDTRKTSIGDSHYAYDHSLVNAGIAGKERHQSSAGVQDGGALHNSPAAPTTASAPAPAEGGRRRSLVEMLGFKKNKGDVPAGTK